MLRISLIIAIVAGLAAAGLNFYQVRQVLVDTMTELDTTKKDLANTRDELGKTKKTLAKTEEDLTATKTKLTQTETSLKTAQANLDAKTKEAADLGDQLTKAVAARDAAQQEIEQWHQLRVSPQQVKGIIADLAKTKEQVAAVQDENKLLSRKLAAATSQLEQLIGKTEKVDMPNFQKGKVIAVDPKFDFVVIDSGEAKGAIPGGECLVNRNGKLVGKIRIAAVQPNQSIANVLPNWKREDIMEGDQVFY